MAKKKVQAVSFEDLKALVVNEAKQNGNVLTQEQIDEYLMNYDLSDELAEELLEYIQQNQITISDDDLDSLDVDDDVLLAGVDYNAYADKQKGKQPVRILPGPIPHR